MIEYVLFVVGVFLLIKGADFLVDGASSLAEKWNVSKLVIGLTVVAFGTSAPELFINVIAALNGESDIALGNIVGSNISNVLLVLGLMIILMNVYVKKDVIKHEIPLSFGAALLLLIFALIPGNLLSWPEGVILLAFFGFFTYRMLKLSRISHPKIEEKKSGKHPVVVTASILGGIIGLYLGGRLVVDNAITIATRLGMSEYTIALTIVAIGTSLPELVTAVVAGIKKQGDIGVGNVVGSNIFNILWVLGVTALIRPTAFPGFAILDITVLLITTVLLFLFIRTDRRRTLRKGHGVIMLVLYLAYVYYLVIR